MMVSIGELKTLLGSDIQTVIERQSEPIRVPGTTYVIAEQMYSLKVGSALAELQLAIRQMICICFVYEEFQLEVSTHLSRCELC